MAISTLVAKLNTKTTTNGHTKATYVAPARPASKKQRRLIYFASLRLGVRFTGIWDAKVSADDLSPACAALRRESGASRQEQLDALDYLEELGIKYEMQDAHKVPSEPVKVEPSQEPKAAPKAKAKPKSKGKTSKHLPLAYGRYVKHSKKILAEGKKTTILSFEDWVANRGEDAPKATPKPKAAPVAKKEPKTEPKKENTLSSDDKLKLLIDHMSAQSKANLELLQALTK